MGLPIIGVNGIYKRMLNKKVAGKCSSSLLTA
jgi:hypothetical protein